MPYDAQFNANEVAPRQVGSKHHVGNKFQATITNTEAKKVKDKDAGLFAVTFTSPGGQIVFNYNLWNESEQARNIAKEQLSALCHATGRFQLNFRTDGAELRGAQCLIDVGYQSGQEPSADKPEGGYVEVKKVYDMAGNEPGKGPAMNQQSQQQSFGQGQPQGQPQQTNQPNNQQQGFGTQVNTAQTNPNGGWGQGQQPNTQQTPPQGNQQQGWSQGGQQQQQPQGGNAGGWNQQQGGNVPQTAPWGNG